jgi:ABC-type transport system substrate-binding protein
MVEGRVTRRSLRIVAALACAAVLMAACAGGDDDDAGGGSATTDTLEPVPGGHLVYAVDSDVDGWNSSSNAWPPRSHTIARAVFDPIAVIDQDGNWAPYLVEAIEPNDDYTVWTFRLRDGVEFHSGEPLDAAALKLHLDTVVGGLVSGSAFKDVVAVREVDPMTVEVEVAQPWTQFPSLLADQPGYVMSPEMIESGSEGNEHPIGTGPFVFDEWVRDDHLTLERNEEYWQEGLPYLETVEFRPMTDASTLLSALDAGDVDALVSIAGSVIAEVPEIEDEGEYTVSRDDGTKAEAVIMFNLDSEVGGDPRIREAIAMAIDKQSLVDTVFSGQFPVANQPYEPDEPWYVEDVGAPEYDPEAAAALVEEYEAENGEMVVTIHTVVGPDFLAALQLVQQQLEEVGIELKIESEEVVAFTQTFIAGEWDVILIGSFFRTADPDNEYHYMHSDNALPEEPIKLNFPRHRSDVVDEALDAARASEDPELRREQYAEVWRAFSEDLPYIFLYHIDSAAIARANVHGLGPWIAPDGSQISSVNGSAQWVTRAWVEQ